MLQDLLADKLPAGRVRSLPYPRFHKLFFRKSDIATNTLVNNAVRGGDETWSRPQLQTLCQWPKKSAGERAYYTPLINLLNKVQKAIPRDKLGLYGHNRFVVYDKEMGDGIQGAHPIKPDGLLVWDTAKAKKTYFWADVNMPIEVKENWKEMIKQLATYARAVFQAQPC